MPGGKTGSGGGGIEVLGVGAAASLLAEVAMASLGADGLRIGRGLGGIVMSEF